MKELVEKNVYMRIIKELIYAPYNVEILLKALNIEYRIQRYTNRKGCLYINTIKNLSAIRNNPQYKTINNLLTNGRLSIVSEGILSTSMI